MTWGRLILAGLVTAAVIGSGQAAELDGPVAAHVLRVTDGDSLTVRAHIWMGQDVTTTVRLAGVDAPELNGRCERERTLAQAARAFLVERVEGRAVSLREIRQDKFGGRVVAIVEDGAGDLGTALLAAQLAVPYGGGARGSWCE